MILGQSNRHVPHIVLLDAGLAAQFDDRIYSNVTQFFQSIIDFDGDNFGKAILGLAPSQPYVKEPDRFVSDVKEKMADQKALMLQGKGRAGDNIRAFMASVREHQVTLDPTVMVALMSMLVLEGWQFRLDPSTSILEAIDKSLRRRAGLLSFLF